jgi:hypothetical protein
MQFRITPNNTSWQGICNWQYSELGYDSLPPDTTRWNAREAFFTFASLDRAVFGYEEFEVTDGQIFFRNQTDTFDVTIESASYNGNNRGQHNADGWQTCYEFVVCRRVVQGTPARNNTQPAPECQEISWCEPSWEIDDGSEGDNGWWPGGDQGGGGSNYIPPPPPQCPPTQNRGLNAVPGCPPRGWNPGNYNPPQPPEPIDSILAKSARAVNNALDSIFQLSLSSGHEWGFAIVKRNDSIYAVNIRTDNDSNEVIRRRFLYLQPGETAIGDAHTHSDPDSTGRSSPSGNDIEGLRGFKNQKNYFRFIEIGHIRYALVVENPDSAQVFFSDITGKYDLHQSHYNLASSDSAAYSNWRLATERTLLQLIGSSSSSGIAVYKSNNSAKTSFVKVN